MPLESGKKVFLGVDFGATNTRAAAVTADGGILHLFTCPTHCATQQESLETIQTAVAGFFREWTGPRPQAIGLGLVGQLDYRNGIWLHSINAHISTPVPLAEQLSGQYGLPVFLDNDVHAATFAELCFGIGRISRDFAVVNLGTGISCGMVSDGRLIRGTINAAGEFGHTCVEQDGAPCACGYFGCLEGVAGGAALAESGKEAAEENPFSTLGRMGKEGDLGAREVFAAAREGDIRALGIARRAVKGLGVGLVNLCNLLNPEYIVLIGSVAQDEWFVGQVRQFVNDNVRVITLGALKDVARSRLDLGSIGVMGAASLCCSALE